MAFWMARVISSVLRVGETATNPVTCRDEFFIKLPSLSQAEALLANTAVYVEAGTPVIPVYFTRSPPPGIMVDLLMT